MKKNVKDIIKDYLEIEGMDGLCNRHLNCECRMDNLFHCEENIGGSNTVEKCAPGYWSVKDVEWDGREDTPIWGIVSPYYEPYKENKK